MTGGGFFSQFSFVLDVKNQKNMVFSHVFEN